MQPGNLFWRNLVGLADLQRELKLSREYRDRVRDGLLKLWRDGALKLVGACANLDVEALVAEMRAKAWEVYIKPAHGEGGTIFEYLSRYINRVALSNYRSVSLEGGCVSFRYRDSRDGGKEKIMTLDALEFLRRFLLHVLPAHFVRIRHYGLHHSSSFGYRLAFNGHDYERGDTICKANRMGLPPRLPAHVPTGHDCHRLASQ